MKILGLIPARGGSKGVPQKNKKLLNGKPLIQYSIEAAQNAKNICHIFVSTDDADIKTIAENNGLNVPFLRPDELANDTASSIDVVAHVIFELEKQNQYFDAVCLLQPTSPFREKDFIDKSIETFIHQETDSLISVLPVPHEFNPHWIFEPNENNNLQIATGENEIIKRRQDLPKAFYRDGSIYITKTEVIKKQHSFYGKSISYFESNPDFYVNIDTLKDWEIAEKKVKTILLD